ncbi:MAG: LON peptidase substrate-binding domain-containing protein [Cocleimonas sp.]|nr:LON peptidase substrate-binding domain-containing protein [Cocleimonas sp.]
MSTELTLFPLNNVLYPGGRLSLRILEPRHLSMVSHCLRQQKPFIATSLKENNDTECAELFNKIGTVAQIINFDMPSTGILEITCRGQGKARIINYQAQKNKLTIGQIEQLPITNIKKLPEEYQVLSNILKNHLQRDGMEKYACYLEEDWGNSDWVSCRLSELLTINQQQHYELFMLEPLQRLCQLKEMMKNNGWIKK